MKNTIPEKITAECRLNIFRSAFPEDTEEYASDFLKKMARVERTQVTIDHKQKTIFLNLTGT